jgi:hypothetical protein
MIFVDWGPLVDVVGFREDRHYPLTPKEAVFMKFGEVTNLKMAGCAFPPSIHPSWWVLFGWMGTVRFKAMMVAWGDLCRR